jgi:glycogen debranching enzyme
MMRTMLFPAKQIALDTLVACATPDGLIAGTHHFVDLWARDSLFASLGANVCGMTTVSRRTIETFLRFQRADGFIPYLVMRSYHTVGKYFSRHTFRKEPVGHFRSHLSYGLVPDGGLMTVIASRHYAETTGDTQFLRKYIDSLSMTMNWYVKQYQDGLIREWFLCEWADAVMKRGSTLYTNVLYWKALADLSWITKNLGRSDDARYWRDRQDKIGRTMNRLLWNGDYFADWKSVFRHDYFASHGNMLAVVFGLATEEQAASILSYARAFCWKDFTLETNFPRYPLWRVPLLHHVVGMGDYHNRGCLWLQPGILYVLALHKSGKKKEAKTILEVIIRKILEHNGIYEVYEKNGRPVRRLLYASEHPFAWSAGLFLWACSVLGFTKK